MIQIFFSYSHADSGLRDELEKHLSIMKRQGLISAWHDRRIAPGSEIHGTIDRELESSEIILLLVSADFINSDYCYEREMERALEKHKEGSATVIPVILRPCDWESAAFGNLRATPTDGKPITLHANQDQAFTEVARDVRKAIETRAGRQEQSPTTSHQSTINAEESENVRSSNLRVKRNFDDHERDDFLENAYEYISRYFEGSLKELESRNGQLSTRYKRFDTNSFAAFVYENGRRVAECSIRYGDDAFLSNGIKYSASGERNSNSFNECLEVTDDGFTQQLRSIGMFSFGDSENKSLTLEGAAELFWSRFIRPLQE